MDKCLPDKKLFNIPFGKQKKTVTQHVKVKIMDLGWMYRYGLTYLDFATCIADYKRDDLFRTVFVSSMADQYWYGFLRTILLRTMLPWVIYSSMSIFYLAKTLNG